MTAACITSSQKLKALGFAKTFWLRLVTGTDTDTESNIYQDLKRVLHDNHDQNIALGSMYFFKMKTALTGDELQQLKDHYSDLLNFNRLQEWEPSEDEAGRRA